MLQSQQKREKFHKQIRQRQHQQIFKKIRKKAQEYHLHQPSMQFQQVLDNIPLMYSISDTVQLIVDNQHRILDYVRQVRNFQNHMKIIQSSIMEYNYKHNNNYYANSNQIVCALIPVLEYFLYVVDTIHKHLLMDVQENQYSEEENQNKQLPFAQLLLPINYMLINLLAQQLPICYIEIIAKFTRYRIFIDCFHNIFLTQNLPKQIKVQLTTQFLVHLQSNPIFFLNNCNVFIRILYYALQQQPKLFEYYEHNHIHMRILRQIQKIYSILTYNDKLQQKAKNQFKKYSCIIMQKLCLKNIKMCWEIINLSSMMKAMEEMLSQLKGMFNVKIKIIQGYYWEHLIACVKFLANLAFYDQVTSCLNQCYPTIWVHLLAILARLSMQYWMKGNQKKKTLPPIFETAQFPTIVLKILKCISNLVCVPELCQHLIRYDFSGKQNSNDKDKIKTQWINILTQMYNGFYKYSQIRVECLCIFTNAIIIIDRSNIFFTKSDIIEQNTQELQQDQIIKIKQKTVTKVDILNQSTDLIMEVLKLSNSNRNIMICVIQTLRGVIEKLGSQYRVCELFVDRRFINRLSSIADSDLIKVDHKGSQFYSEDVRLQAHHLVQALMINNQ